MEQLIENNIVKEEIKLSTFLKSDIKKAVEWQRFLKTQRKTKNLVGKRVIHHNEAAWKHLVNREELRIMYAAYGLLKGKSFSQIENRHPEENHPLNEFKTQIDKIISVLTVKKKKEQC